jgi:hypothetical protein
VSEFDSPDQIRVPPNTWPEPYAAAEKAKILNEDTLKDSCLGSINPSNLPCESREAPKAVSVSGKVEGSESLDQALKAITETEMLPLEIGKLDDCHQLKKDVD